MKVVSSGDFETFLNSKYYHYLHKRIYIGFRGSQGYHLTCRRDFCNLKSLIYKFYGFYKSICFRYPSLLILDPLLIICVSRSMFSEKEKVHALVFDVLLTSMFQYCLVFEKFS